MGSLAATVGALVIVVLVAFGLLFLRVAEVENRIDALGGDVSPLQTEISGLNASMDQLRSAVEDLEESIRDEPEVTAPDATPGPDPTDVAASIAEIRDNLRDMEGTLRSLHDRVDEICRNVPVC